MTFSIWVPKYKSPFAVLHVIGRGQQKPRSDRNRKVRRAHLQPSEIYERRMRMSPVKSFLPGGGAVLKSGVAVSLVM